MGLWGCQWGRCPPAGVSRTDMDPGSGPERRPWGQTSFFSNSAFLASNSSCVRMPLALSSPSFSSVAITSSALTPAAWVAAAAAAAAPAAVALQPGGQVLRQHLAQRHAGTQAHGVAGNAAAAAAPAFGELRNRLRGLVLHELVHVVADHAHADPLVQYLLQLFGKREVLHRHDFELQADFGELGGASWAVSASANLSWLAARSRNGMPADAMALLMFCSTRPRNWPSTSCTV